jgi:hypothetical protein
VNLDTIPQQPGASSAEGSSVDHASVDLQFDLRKIEEEDKSGVETSSLEDVEITEDEGSEYTSQLPKSSNTKSNRYAGDVGGGPPE